jgi:hypothetical protein
MAQFWEKVRWHTKSVCVCLPLPSRTASRFFESRPAHADSRRRLGTPKKFLERLRLYKRGCEIRDSETLILCLEAAYNRRVWKTRREPERAANMKWVHCKTQEVGSALLVRSNSNGQNKLTSRSWMSIHSETITVPKQDKRYNIKRTNSTTWKEWLKAYLLIDSTSIHRKVGEEEVNRRNNGRKILMSTFDSEQSSKTNPYKWWWWWWWWWW